MTEPSTKGEEERGEDHEGDHIASLMCVQSWRDELPDLIEDYWTRHEQGGNEGDFELGKERFGRARTNQCWRARLYLPQGLCKKSEEEVGKSVSGNESQTNCDQRLDKTRAQFFQMAQERHRTVVIFQFPLHWDTV